VRATLGPLNASAARRTDSLRLPALTADRLEDDLIDDESPFKGTRAFGMALLDGREMASLGTMLHIEQHERFPDGRMVIVSKGGRRFRVVRVVKQQPVLVCEVQWIDDYPDQMSGDDDFTLDELADEVRSLYRTVVRLSNKVNGLEDDPEDEDALPNKLSPQEASFWYLNEFGKFPATQQVRNKAQRTHGASLTKLSLSRDPRGYWSSRPRASASRRSKSS